MLPSSSRTAGTLNTGAAGGEPAGGFGGRATVGACPAPTPTGLAAGADTTALQCGHFTCLPASAAGTCMRLLHLLHVNFSGCMRPELLASAEWKEGAPLS